MQRFKWALKTETCHKPPLIIQNTIQNQTRSQGTQYNYKQTTRFRNNKTIVKSVFYKSGSNIYFKISIQLF